MADQEIRDLHVATARAYAIAERLAYELDNTVTELLDYVAVRPNTRSLNDDQTEERKVSGTASSRRQV